MTLPIKYNQIMKRVVVTPDMQERIMSNLRNTNLEILSKRSDKRIFNSKKRSAIVAACFVLLVSGGLLTYHYNYNYQYNTKLIGNEVTMPGIGSYTSIQELIEGTGLEIKELKNLPFEVEQIYYSSIDSDIAQIQYTGTYNSATFRASRGKDNISGIYNEFQNTDQFQVESNLVTVKGSNGVYELATWSSNGYSYSLSLEKGITQDEIASMITSLE